MQEQKFRDLEDRASLSAEIDAIKKLEARERVLAEVENMKQSGEALALSDEEIKLLQSFRRFKLRMRKNGEVFKWQSVLPAFEVVQETGLIADPQEVL